MYNSRKYTPNELNTLIDSFPTYCMENGKLPILENLYLYLDLYNEQFHELASIPEYAEIIKKARQMTAAWLADSALAGRTKEIASIFLLKAVHGYSDKQEISVDGKITVDFLHDDLAD